MEKKKIEKNDDGLQISGKSEKIIEENYGNTLVKNILNPKQIIDDNTKSLTIAPKKGFDHLDYLMMYI
jgi:hypothetical protein